MSPVRHGIVLGLINTVVVAFGLAASAGDPLAQVVPAVIFFGAIPAILLGASAGSIAGAQVLADRPRSVRIPLIALLPCAFVLGMGKVVGIFDYAAGACIPTLVAVLLLERSTRSSSSSAAEQLPPARVFAHD